MELQINGQKASLEGPVSLEDYLKSQNVLAGRIACELNGKIVRRKDLGSVVLQAGDTLEIITIVGGG